MRITAPECVVTTSYVTATLLYRSETRTHPACTSTVRPGCHGPARRPHPSTQVKSGAGGFGWSARSRMLPRAALHRACSYGSGVLRGVVRGQWQRDRGRCLPRELWSRRFARKHSFLGSFPRITFEQHGFKQNCRCPRMHPATPHTPHRLPRPSAACRRYKARYAPAPPKRTIQDPPSIVRCTLTKALPMICVSLHNSI